MELGGTIKLKGPEFEKKEITFENDAACDFYLETEKAGVPVVDDFDVSVQVSNDKEIKISIPDLSNDDILFNYLLVVLKGEGGQLSLDLSVEQAAVLSEVLQHYVTAFYEAKGLRTERVVKSA